MASNNDFDDEGYFGPELPPNISSQVEIGPQIPIHFKSKTDNEQNDEDMEEFVKQIAAQIPQEEDADTYGPMPCSDSDEIRKNFVIKEIEGRAAKTKQLLLEGKKEELKREAWMTELPPQLSGAVGLCERRFKTSNAVINTDRSVWTDTPADKERKMKSDDKHKAKNNKISPIEELIQAKNTQQRLMVADYEKKNDRTKSLFELHSEKLKKKRKRSSSSSSSSSGDRRSKKHKKKDKKNKKAEKEPTRRPFDRNVDLQTVNMLDSTQRAALMKRSKELNSKFMHGKSHYL